MTLSAGKPPPRPNQAGRRTVRFVLLVLIVWFLLWLAIGTVIRIRMERPARFIGRSEAPGSISGFASPPLHLGHARAVVLDASHHKQKV